MATVILHLTDTERPAYQTLMRALASQRYTPPHITDQVVAAIERCIHDDGSLVAVGQRVIQLLRDDTSITTLMVALADRDLCYPAALFLGWCGARALPAVPALVHAAGWGPTRGVGAAITALTLIGGDPTPIVTGLERALHESNDDAFVQLMSVVTARDLTTHNQVYTLLRTAAAHANAAIRERTADAIVTLPPVQRVLFAEIIQRLITDESPHVRAAMQQAASPA